MFQVLEVRRVEMVLPDQYPKVWLRETEAPFRDFSFPVGLVEGTALANAMEGMTSLRPLTHELTSMILRKARADIVAVRLIGRSNGVYLAEAEIMMTDGHVVLSCRPSDGIILALRQGVRAPILIDDRLFEGTWDVEPDSERSTSKIESL